MPRRHRDRRRLHRLRSNYEIPSHRPASRRLRHDQRYRPAQSRAQRRQAAPRRDALPRADRVMPHHRARVRYRDQRRGRVHRRLLAVRNLGHQRFPRPTRKRTLRPVRQAGSFKLIRSQACSLGRPPDKPRGSTWSPRHFPRYPNSSDTATPPQLPSPVPIL
jgi:hypothetical protein